MNDLVILIDSLPKLLMYVVPGYLFIWMIWHVTSWKEQNDNHLILKSIIISYLMISISMLVYGEESLDSISSKAILFVVSIVLGYVVGLFLGKDWLWDGLRRIGISQTGTYFLRDIADFKRGMWANVYLPNDKVIYSGKLLKFEEKDNPESSYLVINKYIQYNYNGTEEVNHREESQFHVLVNTRDVSRIELTYDENSSKLS